MHIDATFVLSIWIFEVVRKSQSGREFVSGLRIEVGVGGPRIERLVSEAKVREAVGIVSPDLDVAREISHVIVDAGIPAQIEHRREVAEAGNLVGTAAADGKTR